MYLLIIFLCISACLKGYFIQKQTFYDHLLTLISFQNNEPHWLNKKPTLFKHFSYIIFEYINWSFFIQYERGFCRWVWNLKQHLRGCLLRMHFLNGCSFTHVLWYLGSALHSTVLVPFYWAASSCFWRVHIVALPFSCFLHAYDTINSFPFIR